MAKHLKVGIALGGGAARAFSHLGVLDGLARHGIRIDIITGTSMGAIIGAMYAAEPDADAIKLKLANYIKSEVFDDSGFNFFKELDSREEGLFAEMGRLARRGVFNALTVTKTSLVSDKTAASNYDYLIPDLDVKQTRIPFAAAALDLRSGEAVILDRGSLRDIIAASCAMPGVLNPVELEGRLLVDGGWSETVPIKAAHQLGADFVIAVDVGDSLRPFVEPRNAIDIVARADSLVRSALNKEQLKLADIVLTPLNGVSHWADFSTASTAIERGAEEVDRRIDDICRALKKARKSGWLW
jgi:NTE family protein